MAAGRSARPPCAQVRQRLATASHGCIENRGTGAWPQSRAQSPCASSLSWCSGGDAAGSNRIVRRPRVGSRTSARRPAAERETGRRRRHPARQLADGDIFPARRRATRSSSIVMVRLWRLFFVSLKRSPNFLVSSTERSIRSVLLAALRSVHRKPRISFRAPVNAATATIGNSTDPRKPSTTFRRSS